MYWFYSILYSESATESQGKNLQMAKKSFCGFLVLELENVRILSA